MNGIASINNTFTLNSDNHTKDNIDLDSKILSDKISNMDKKSAKKLTNMLKKRYTTENTHIVYEINKRFGDIVFKIVENDTKKVIREVPPKKILDMIAKMCDLNKRKPVSKGIFNKSIDKKV